MQPTFVLSTGRCGSTLLSHILHRHPEVLSISELFCAIQVHPDDLRTGRLSGQEFWDLLSAPQPFLDVMIQGEFPIDELRYRRGSGRFSPETGIPGICHMTLPLLTSDPDTLFDVLAADVPSWPARPAASQFSVLFDRLAARFGRTVVVERTGGSVMMAPLLHAMFPTAKFVHMHRDGPDCALSMSRHPGARVLGLAEHAGLLGGAPPGSAPPPGPLSPQLAAALTPPLDAWAVMACPNPPLQTYGRLWSRMVTIGAAVLRRLPPSQWTTLAYEDLITDPDRELSRLAEFIGARLVPGWLPASRGMIGSSRVGQASALDPDDLCALQVACEPGRQAIEEMTAESLPPA
ncbi:MAG TPA: sulfotransferase [Streptosporangiaceae bacterium]|nr:sulfotransferase [Streptosporangiaceae bacterium]